MPAARPLPITSVVRVGIVFTVEKTRVVTESGMVRVVSFELTKAVAPMEVTPLPRVSEASEVQSPKELSPSEVTVLGMVTAVRPMQPEKL